MAQKKASSTEVTMTQLVLPNDTNNLDNLRGGKLLHWMDLAAAVSAQKHCNNIVVTALNAKVSRAFSSSMEVFIEVWAENIPARRKVKSNEAYFSFVALNDLGKPEPVPELIPETDLEKEHYNAAAVRRTQRLEHAGRRS